MIELLINVAIWPCGCVVAFSRHIPHSEDLDAIECPWCDAGYNSADLRRWFSKAKRISPFIASHRPLLLLGKTLFDAIPHLNGSSFYIRERVFGAAWKSLQVPLSAIEILQN